MEYQIEIYQTDNGKLPYKIWLSSLCDTKAKAIIRLRLDRLRLGNFGNCKSVGDGVFELKIDYGPGYRVYYTIRDRMLIVLLAGGDKRTQEADIKIALRLARNL